MLLWHFTPIWSHVDGENSGQWKKKYIYKNQILKKKWSGDIVGR